MSENQHRRREDFVAVETARRIDDLIAQSHDPVQQATLLVLSKINISLDSNTTATERIATELASHREDFQEHDREELRRMAWIRGAWWAMAMMFGAFLAIVVYGINRHLAESDSIHTDLATMATRIKILEHFLLK